ncbi:MAG: hypothetical protein ACPLRA_02520 [Candidatus Saccharicenans sp.]
MEAKESHYFLPALLGGALAGVASAVPFLNCLCCLWVMAGAVFSCYLLADSARKNSIPFKTNDGLLVGTLSGIFAGIINTFIEIPLAPVYQNVAKRFLESLSKFVEEMPAGWENILQRRSWGFSALFLILNLVLSCLIFGFLGALGGLIGFSLFKPAPGEKNATPSQNPGDNQSGL